MSQRKAVLEGRGFKPNFFGKGSRIETLRISPHLMEEMNALLATLNYPIVGSDGGAGSYTDFSSDMSEDKSETPVPFPVNAGEILTNFVSSQLNNLIEALEGRQVIYKIIVTGNHGGTWIIDLTDPDCPIKMGNGAAECTLTFSPKDAIDIVNGTSNPVELWMQGKLQVSGDRKLAEVFCWLLVSRLQWRKPSASWWLE